MNFRLMRSSQRANTHVLLFYDFIDRKLFLGYHVGLGLESSPPIHRKFYPTIWWSKSDFSLNKSWNPRPSKNHDLSKNQIFCRLDDQITDKHKNGEWLEPAMHASGVGEIRFRCQPAAQSTMFIGKSISSDTLKHSARYIHQTWSPRGRTIARQTSSSGAGLVQELV